MASEAMQFETTDNASRSRNHLSRENLNHENLSSHDPRYEHSHGHHVSQRDVETALLHSPSSSDRIQTNNIPFSGNGHSSQTEIESALEMSQR